MDTTYAKVETLIVEAIEEYNEVLPPEEQLATDVQATLYGKDGRIDSLGLVTLLTDIEERINDTFDATIALADERAVAQEKSPFRSAATLARYATDLLEAAA